MVFPTAKQSNVLFALPLAAALSLLAGRVPAAETNAPATGHVSVISTTETLRITVSDAILMALEHNPGFRVQRLNPEITRTREADARAAFDPALSAQISRQRNQAPAAAVETNSTSSAEVTADRTAAQVALETRLPTGTQLGLEGSTANSHSGTDQASSRAGLTLTQSLLNGFGPGVNLASLRQARLDTRISVFELRGFAQTLVADVEKTYWDYILAQRQVEIFRESLRLAEEQLKETMERIRVGKLPEIEAAAAEAEVSLRHESLINAESASATTRLRLLRLLNPSGLDMWSCELALQDQPAVSAAPPDNVEDHVQLAFRWRPDIHQARLGLQRGDLELVKTRNGLLPRLDFFVSLGRTGYASSFDDSLRGETGDGHDTTVGLRLDYPLVNRAARAGHRRALLNWEQAGEALTNLYQLAQLDVRSAYIEAQRARAQVAATAATRRLQEAKLRAETEKFRVGKSTSLLVAQAQRDLVQSQVGEIEAVVNALQASVELYRLDGSLLDRRGITIPGTE